MTFLGPHTVKISKSVENRQFPLFLYFLTFFTEKKNITEDTDFPENTGNDARNRRFYLHGQKYDESITV